MKHCHYPSFVARFPLILSLVALGGCSTVRPQPSPRAVASPVVAPPYADRLAEAFDDRIDRASLDLGQAVPATLDALLHERAAAADWIVRGRIAAVTREQVGGTETVRLTFVTEGEPVAGPLPPSPALELSVREGNPFYRVLDGHSDRLTSRKFMAYVKRFNDAGVESLHWYMATESPEALAVIGEMHVLREVRAGNP